MSEKKSQVLLALGSNLGDRQGYLDSGMTALESFGTILKYAPVYETAPLGPNADKAFLNTAIIYETALLPEALLKFLHDIERASGRQLGVHWGNRTLDIDIILWQDHDGHSIVHDTPGLKIPHPECLNRAFVLIPAAEIASEWRHPLTGRSLGDQAATIKKGSLSSLL